MEETKKPLVSVVMTSYNRGHYIEQAIDSILSQECTFPIEIIIGDDCSTDNSRELLVEYQAKYPKIIVLNLQKKNQGFGRNWASTVKMARGKYVAFLDDDDYWCDDHRLQEMVDYMEGHENCGLVHTSRWIYDVDNDKKWQSHDGIPEGEDKVKYMDSKGFPVLFSSAMIRKSLMDAHVKLDDFIRLDIPIQDWPTAMLIAPYCDFHCIDKPSVVYRHYKGSMSKPKEYEQIITKYAKEKVMNRYVHEQLGQPFNERGWDCYVNHLLMSMAYDREEYEKAKYYGKLRGRWKIKVICSKSKITFMMFIMMRKIKNEIKSLLRSK